MRRICWWSMTTAASAICCRAFSAGEGYRVSTAETAADARAKLNRPEFRSAHSRRHDAGRIRFRFRQVAARHIQCADPDADGARRRREPHQGSRDGRRRLSVEAVRAARTVAAHRQYSQAHAAGGGAAGRVGALRTVRLSPRARRIAQRRGDHPADRPRARNAAHSCRRRRAKPWRAWRSPAMAARSASAPSTCRSTGCAARSSAIPPIRCSCRRCAASATGWWSPHDQPRHRHAHHPHGRCAARGSLAVVRRDSVGAPHSRRARAYSRRLAAASAAGSTA